MKIKCTSDYQGRFRDAKIGYVRGQDIEASDELINFLKADCPGSFRFPGDKKGKPGPEEDKMLGGPELSKLKVKDLKALLRKAGLPVGGNQKALVARLEEAAANA